MLRSARPLRAALGTFCCLALLGAPSTAAASSWLPATMLSAPGEDAVTPDMAVGADGTAAVIWRSEQFTDSQVKVAVHEPGGTWTAPTALSPGTYDWEPRVTVGPNGTTTAIWLERPSNVGASAVVRAAERPAGGSWSTPVTISTPGENAFASLSIGSDDAGSLVATWLHQEIPSSTGEFMAAVRRGGVWQTPAHLSAMVQSPYNVELAVSAQGPATAVWVYSDGTHTRLGYAAMSAGGTWSAAKAVTDGTADEDYPSLADDAAGNTTMVWRRKSDWTTQAATLPVGGNWSTHAIISDPSVAALDPDVDVDAAGNATAAWRTSGLDPQQLAVVDRPAGGAWTAPTQLTSTGRNGFEVEVAKSASGATGLTWRHATEAFTSADQETMQATVRGTSGWAPTTDLFAPFAETYDSRIATDDAGNMVTTWRRSTATATASTGSPYAMEVRALDNAGPQFTAPGSLRVPTTGTVGVPVSMSATAVDAWSSVAGPVAWQTGDGGTATGSATTHTYAKPGTYAVTASATDSLGNVGSATRTITITAVGSGASGGTTPGSATPAFAVRGKLATFTKALLTKRPGAKRCPKARALVITMKAAGRAVAIRRRKLTITKTSRGCLLSGTATLKKAVKAKTTVTAKVRGTGLKGRTLRAIAG